MYLQHCINYILILTSLHNIEVTYCTMFRFPGHGKRNGNQLQNLRSTTNDVGGDGFLQFPQEEYGGFNQVVPKQQIPFLKIPHSQKQSSYYVGNLRGENPTLQKLFRLSSLRPRPLGMNARNIKLSLDQQLVDDGDVDSGGSTDDRGILNDSLIVPEMMPSSLKATSQEIVTNPRVQLPSGNFYHIFLILPGNLIMFVKFCHTLTCTAFKRNEDDGIGNSPGGGTEEPLETSANGLDTGVVATFFRDRKASERPNASGNSGTDRFVKYKTCTGPTIFYHIKGRITISVFIFQIF